MQVPDTFSSADQPFVDDTSCRYQISTTNFCGYYHQTCAAGSDFDYDYLDYINIQGTATAVWHARA